MIDPQDWPGRWDLRLLFPKFANCLNVELRLFHTEPAATSMLLANCGLAGHEAECDFCPAAVDATFDNLERSQIQRWVAREMLGDVQLIARPAKRPRCCDIAGNMLIVEAGWHGYDFTRLESFDLPFGIYGVFDQDRNESKAMPWE